MKDPAAIADFPLSIIIKDRGYYNQFGCNKLCILASGSEFHAYKHSNGADYVAFVENNAWGEVVQNHVIIESENISSWQKRTV